MNIAALADQLVKEYIDNGYIVTEELKESIIRNEDELNDYHEFELIKDGMSQEELNFACDFENMMQCADIEGYEFT